MTTVACVLKTGGDFDASYVDKLGKAIRKHWPKVNFVCLTDDQDGVTNACATVETIGLNFDLPRWWSKLELFSLKGKVIALDLDTVIVDECPELLSAVDDLDTNDIIMLKDFNSGRPASGLMAWNGDWSGVLSAFLRVVENGHFQLSDRGCMLRFARHRYRGDQEWLAGYFRQGRRIKFAQDITDGIFSYKVDVLKRYHGKLPDEARIVCFHGRPRPHEVIGSSWLDKHWGQEAADE